MRYNLLQTCLHRKSNQGCSIMSSLTDCDLASDAHSLVIKIILCDNNVQAYIGADSCLVNENMVEHGDKACLTVKY